MNSTNHWKPLQLLVYVESKQRSQANMAKQRHKLNYFLNYWFRNNIDKWRLHIISRYHKLTNRHKKYPKTNENRKLNWINKAKWHSNNSAIEVWTKVTKKKNQVGFLQVKRFLQVIVYCFSSKLLNEQH